LQKELQEQLTHEQEALAKAQQQWEEQERPYRLNTDDAVQKLQTEVERLQQSKQSW
jgi:hypothetical protein